MDDHTEDADELTWGPWGLELAMLRDTVEARPVRCPRCGRDWLASISAEDIADGVGTDVICGGCLL